MTDTFATAATAPTPGAMPALAQAPAPQPGSPSPLSIQQQQSLSLARARAAATPTQAAAPGAAAATPDAAPTRGNLFPVEVTPGHVSLAVPQFLVGPFQTIHDLVTGQRTIGQVSGKEIFDLGTTFGAMGPGTQFLKPGLAALSDTAAAASRIGVSVPRAITDTSVATRLGAKITSTVPYAGQPEKTAAQTALDQLGDVAKQTRDATGTGNVPAAGGAIQQGVTAFAGPKGTLSDGVSAAYDKVDQLIDPNASAPLPQTADVAQKINQARTAAGAPPSKAVGLILDAVTRPDGLTYAGISKLRTIVGEMINSPTLGGADTSNAELKQIYGALTSDTRSVIQKTGGDPAVVAWDAATEEAGKAAQVRADLAKVVGGDTSSEEAVFSRVLAMTGSTARADVNTLNQARLAVGGNWNTVLSAMVNKWGFDASGNFNPGQFAKQWAAVTPEAKQVIFQGADGKQLRTALDDIATVSGKAGELSNMAAPRRVGMITGALGLAGAHALFNVAFNPVAELGPLVGAYGLSRILAKPEGAAAVAGWAKAYQGAYANPGSIGGTLGRAAHALAVQVAGQQGLPATGQAVSDLTAKFASPDPQTLALRQFLTGQEEALKANAAAGKY